MNRKDFLKTLGLVPVAAVVAPTLLVSKNKNDETQVTPPKDTSNKDIVFKTNGVTNGVEIMRISSNGNISFY